MVGVERRINLMLNFIRTSKLTDITTKTAIPIPTTMSTNRRTRKRTTYLLGKVFLTFPKRDLIKKEL